jgi:hypothetical protein
MKTENEPIVSFLRHVYFSGGDFAASVEEFRRIESDLGLFSLGAPVYQRLKAAGRLEEIPQELQAALKHDFDTVLFQNLRLKHEVRDILKNFERRGIAAIPFNGISFAESYYGHYGAREAHGVDILVHPSEAEEAAKAVAAAGYRTLSAGRADAKWLFVKDAANRKTPACDKLHASLTGKTAAAPRLIAVWREARPMGFSSYMKNLSPTHSLYRAILSGMENRMESLLYAVDILSVLVKEANQIDYGQLFKLARRDGTLRKVRFALSVAYGLFPELYHVKPCSFLSEDTCWTLSAIRKTARGDFGAEVWIYRLRFTAGDSDLWKGCLRALVLYFFPSLNPYSPDRRTGKKGIQKAGQR